MMSEQDATTPDGIIRRYALWSAGAGLVPVPVIDMVLVGGVQLKMIAELARHYGTSFDEARTKALIGTTVGTLVPYGVLNGIGLTAACVIKSVPVLGALSLVLVPSASWASTWALGKVFAQHFATGGSLLDFDPDRVREHYRAEFEAARAAGVPAETNA
jgi:uncharacterized protein (DUF697 family)